MGGRGNVLSVERNNSRGRHEAVNGPAVFVGANFNYSKGEEFYKKFN